MNNLFFIGIAWFSPRRSSLTEQRAILGDWVCFVPDDLLFHKLIYLCRGERRKKESRYKVDLNPEIKQQIEKDLKAAALYQQLDESKNAKDEDESEIESKVEAGANLQGVSGDINQVSSPWIAWVNFGIAPDAQATGGSLSLSIGWLPLLVQVMVLTAEVKGCWANWI